MQPLDSPARDHASHDDTTSLLPLEPERFVQALADVVFGDPAKGVSRSQALRNRFLVAFAQGELTRRGRGSGRGRSGRYRALALATVVLYSYGLAGQGVGSAFAQYGSQRAEMVDLIVAYGVQDSATLAAMRSIPRHEFVPAQYRTRAYRDSPLPIGYGQTISQPYIVAFMTEILQTKPGMKVLEVGTGSGFQAAVLARIGCEVYTVEIFEELANRARLRLHTLGFTNVTVRHGDGHFGWEEEAPFDAIIVTAAAGYIPPALIEQLKPGGRMVVPVGSVYGVQNLILIEKDEAGEPRTRNLLPVAFVPMLKGLR